MAKKRNDRVDRELQEFATQSANREQAAKEARIKFTALDFNPFEPITPAQENFVIAYSAKKPNGEDYHIMNAGFPGTGKTFLALQMALREVIIEKAKDKVIIVRSPVPARDQGALPGDQSEKDAPYTLPYISLCDEIFKYKSNNFENLIKKGLLDFRTNGNLRGLTFNDAIIIVDECQNFNFSELETLITRVGLNTRIILCGDSAQTDLTRNKFDVSGFDQMYDLLKTVQSCKVIDFEIEDIVRSGFVKEYIIAKYEKITGKKYVPNERRREQSHEVIHEKPALLG